MDTLRTIDDKIIELRKLRERLEHEIDDFNNNIQHIESNQLGFMNHFKAMVARRIAHGAGTEAVLGEAYAFKKNQEFNSAQELIDYLKRSAGYTKEAISRVDQVVSNLEKIKNDLRYQLDGLQSWLGKADEILK